MEEGVRLPPTGHGRERLLSLQADGLRARHSDAQKAEAVVACNVLNRMLELGDQSPERELPEIARVG